MKSSLSLLSIGALALTWVVTANAWATETATVPDKPPARAVCEEAVVSPVSGFAECVKPRGAPVAPAPKRPPPSTAPGKAPTSDQAPAH
ncbi:MAG: hypothetical protein ACRESY_01580 [Steroidobacteraceae bacterium]